MLALGKLRLSWVNCRIRENVEVARCFRCHGYGHLSRGCTLPGRKDELWGHVARGQRVQGSVKVPDMC